MPLTNDPSRKYSGHAEREAAIKQFGGIPKADVVDGKAKVPAGWVLDARRAFYVPPDSEFVEDHR